MKKKYIEYGEKHNLKLREQLIFETHMREYAKTSGAIALYEKTGKVSEEYTEYKEAYREKVFGVDNSKGLILEMYKDNNSMVVVRHTRCCFTPPPLGVD